MRITKRGLTNVVVVVAVALGVGACAKPDHPEQGGVLNEPQTPVSAEVWLPVACQMIADVVAVQNRAIGSGLDAEDVTTETGRTKIRDAVAAELEKRRDDTNALLIEFHRAGVPKVDGGSLRVQLFERALEELGTQYERMAKQAGAVPVDDRDDFESGLQAALAGLETGSAAMRAARDGTANDPAFRERWAKTPACQAL